MFNSIADIRKEYDAVSMALIQRGYRYSDVTDTYYAPKGDDEGHLLCKKYKALSRVLDACYNLEELYATALEITSTNGTTFSRINGNDIKLFKERLS